MVTSGINTQTKEIAQNIELTMGIDDAVALRESLLTADLVPLKVLTAVTTVIELYYTEFDECGIAIEEQGN